MAFLNCEAWDRYRNGGTWGGAAEQTLLRWIESISTAARKNETEEKIIALIKKMA